MHVGKEQKRKLDPKTRPCIFLGYDDDEFSYRLWNLSEKKVIRSRDIVFSSMYYFASSVSDQLLSHIWDTKMPKEAWTNLKKVFAARSTAWKLQLKDLSNVRQKDMSVADYTTRIKEIYESLASINVTVEEDKMVALKFGAFRMAICTRENTPSIFDL